MKYKLLDKQKEFMEVPHQNKLDVAIYQGGYGSGKTFAGSLLGILLCKTYPGCRGLVGAKEYELVRKTTMASYFEHLEAMGYVRGKHYKYNKVDKEITFNNGSKILFSGLDDPEKIKSLNLHWAEVEEISQIGDSSFKQILGRLRNTVTKPYWQDFKFRLFGHTNPQASKGWIYKRFVEKHKENYRLIIAPTTNNIYLPEHYVQSMQEDFDEEYFRINVLGEFGDYASGLVVKGFSDKNIREINYIDTLPLHITCDFNVDPMSWVIAHKDEKCVFAFDEIVIENTTTEQTITEFLRRYPNHKAQIIINGDASGDNRSCTSEFTNYMIIKRKLEEHGYKDVKFELRPYNPPILSRVSSFNAKVRNSKGDVFFFVDKKCKWLIHNMRNLAYKEGTSLIDAPTHYQIKKDREKKFFGHIFDAISYLVEYYFPIR